MALNYRSQCLDRVYNEPEHATFIPRPIEQSQERCFNH
jgi:hypothetical protein